MSMIFLTNFALSQLAPYTATVSATTGYFIGVAQPDQLGREQPHLAGLYGPKKSDHSQFWNEFNKQKEAANAKR
jgi:hypothetical protein